jgi:large subunit ribosomal protein L35
MPKMKTRSSVKKRFLLTASGRVRHRKAFRAHILTKKSRKRKRNLRRGGFVGSTQDWRIRHMLVVA